MLAVAWQGDFKSLAFLFHREGTKLAKVYKGFLGVLRVFAVQSTNFNESLSGFVLL
jgi:hypothetical protein